MIEREVLKCERLYSLNQRNSPPGSLHRILPRRNRIVASHDIPIVKVGKSLIQLRQQRGKRLGGFAPRIVSHAVKHKFAPRHEDGPDCVQTNRKFCFAA